MQHGPWALNSNLILLIRAGRFGQWRGCWPPLNSNLILLIPVRQPQLSVRRFPFKFQSDSINTNTTITPSAVAVTFKFQSDSINTECRNDCAWAVSIFKFQSDSINTYGLPCYCSPLHVL